MALSVELFDHLPLPGNGDLTGAFWNRERSILALVSTFRLLTEPPARAAYGGHRLRHRISLYRPPLRRPFAVFDGAKLPVNSVAFHPSRPIVLLGGGDYDGGYQFEGELLLWDWESSQTRDVGRVPTVVNCDISTDGSAATVTVCPWDEGFAEDKGGDPFGMFFVLSLKNLFDGASVESEIGAQLDTQTPKAAAEIGVDASRTRSEPINEISGAFGVTYRRRSPIWDAALINEHTIGIVHDDCLIDLFSRDGTPRRVLTGEGHGVQLLGSGATTFVHSVKYGLSAAGWSTCDTKISKLNGDELIGVAAFEGGYTFSISHDGVLLGRCDRLKPRDGPKKDLIVTREGKKAKSFDLGHYDVFNHFLRVDGAPSLFFVQGTPPKSHEHKFVCTVDHRGSVRRLWPILEDRGDHASHAMECNYAYIRDALGAGLVVAGQHYGPAPRGYDGFLYRKSIDGVELWRHQTNASATSIKTTRDGLYIVAAFLDGTIGVFRARDGEVVKWGPVETDGYPAVIVSLDIDEKQILLGSLDGRLGVAPVGDFVS